MAELKENSKLVLSCVYDAYKEGKDVTAQDISTITGLEVRSINGIVTSTFQRHKDENKVIIPLMVRVPAEILDPATGLHKPIKFIQLTEDGVAFAEEVLASED